MNLKDLHAALLEAVPVEKLCKIEDRLTRTIEPELRKRLAALDALPKEIAPSAREAFFAEVFVLLMAACVNAVGRARQHIENGAVETPAVALDKPRAAIDTEDDERSPGVRKDADDLTRIELRQRVVDLEAENAVLRADCQQAHQKIKKLEEECDTLRRTVEFEPKSSDVPRDELIHIRVSKQLCVRAQQEAKKLGLEFDSYISRALVIVDPQAAPYVGNVTRSRGRPPATPQRE